MVYATMPYDYLDAHPDNRFYAAKSSSMCGT